MGAQQTRYIDPMLFQCWSSVADGGPTLKQHWVNVSCWWDDNAICGDARSQKAVAAHFSSKQLLPLDFAVQYVACWNDTWWEIPLISTGCQWRIKVDENNSYLLAPAVTVGETEGAMDSTSVFFGLFFCL